MSPEEIKELVNVAISSGAEFPWWSYVISTAIGGLIAFLVPYLNRRGEHRADLESMPVTASAVLRVENHLNAKRDAYYEAITVLTRFSASVTWSGPDVPIDRVPESNRPLESEVNSCVAKLSMFSDDSDIPLEYIKSFQDMSPVTLGRVIDLMRRDLGYGSLPFDYDCYLYHYRRN
ncbi:hypothetical protein NG726_24595 [Pseudomonas sp. MOB-449]|nr:hypothetical protein [Pseudomonas sp. MOB-449]